MKNAIGRSYTLFLRVVALSAFLSMLVLPALAVEIDFSDGSQPCISADGNKIVYPKANNIFAYIQGASNPINLSAIAGVSGKTCQNPSISPNGQYVVFDVLATPSIYNIYYCDITTSPVQFKPLTSAGKNQFPVVDNNGNVAYRYLTGANTTGIKVCTVAGNNSTELVVSSAGIRYPTISGNGKCIAIEENASSISFYTQGDDGKWTAMSDVSIPGKSPSLSYDGGKIAYVNGSQVEVRTPISNQQPLISEEGLAPRISSKNVADATSDDGRFVTFVSAGNVRVYDTILKKYVSVNTPGTTPSVSANGVSVAYINGAKVNRAENSAPTAVVEDAYTVAEDHTLTVLADQSLLKNDTDQDTGNTLTAAVVSGKGSQHGALTLKSDGTFTYQPVADYDGTDSFTYEASDGIAISNEITVTINVTPENDAPVAVADGPYTVAEDGTLEVSAAEGLRQNDTDVDGDSLSAVLVTDKGVQHGSLTLNPDGSFTYQPAADYNGTDNFTYVASDGTLTSNEIKIDISVTPLNDPPVNTTAPSISGVFHPGKTLQADAGVWNDSIDNPAAGTITYTYRWLRADTDAGANPTVVGTATTYPVTTDDQAKYLALEVTAKDDGTPGSASTVLTTAYTQVSNAAPTINTVTPSSATCAEDQQDFTVALAATDAEGDALTWTLTGESDGTAAFTAGKTGDAVTVSFIPTPDFNGAASFTIEAADSLGGVVSRTVNITVDPVNDAPVAVADGPYTVAEDGTLTVAVADSLLYNDTDKDDDSLTAVLVDGKGPQHGALSLDPKGSFTYTPATDYHGADSFTYVASDGTATSNEIKIEMTVTAVNDAPVISSIADQTINENEESAAIAFSITDVDTAVASVEVKATSSDQTLIPDGNITLTQDGGNWTVKVNPAQNVYGDPVTITVTADDKASANNTSTRSFSVTINMVMPQLQNDEYQVYSGVRLSVPAKGVLANDGTAPGITVRQITGEGKGPNHGALTLNADGSFNYISDVAYRSGTDTFTYVVVRDEVQSTEATVTITILPSYYLTSSVETLDGDPGEVGGTISPNGTVRVNANGYQFYTAKPSAGFGIDKWVLTENTPNQSIQQGGLTYDLSEVTADQTLTVYFKKNFPAPTVATINGSATGVTNANVGQLPVTLTGTGFRKGATVYLTRSDLAIEQRITASDIVVDINAQTIKGNLNFTRNDATAPWTLVVSNDDGKSYEWLNAITLEEAKPHLRAITPANGRRNSEVTIDIVGYGFANDATAKLTKINQEDVPFTTVTFCSQTLLRGTVSLPDTVGDWNVVITNVADGKSTEEPVVLTVGADPAPTLANVSPTLVKKVSTGAVTATFTLTGTNFMAPSVNLRPSGASSSATDLRVNVSNSSDTQLTGSLTVTNVAEGKYDIILTNVDGQSATLANAFTVLPAGLSTVSLAMDRPGPQPYGSTITLTASKTGSTAAEVEYAFYAKYYNGVTQQWIEIPLSRDSENNTDYTLSTTQSWKPATPANYYLYVKAREKGSGTGAYYQVISSEAFYQISDGSIASVELNVTPFPTCKMADTLTLHAVKTGSAKNVEYRFYGYKKNTTTSKWEFFDMGGYQPNDMIVWDQKAPGEFMFGVYARVVGSTATYQKSAKQVKLTITAN